jgi:hypothetical protein
MADATWYEGPGGGFHVVEVEHGVSGGDVRFLLGRRV